MTAKPPALRVPIMVPSQYNDEQGVATRLLLTNPRTDIGFETARQPPLALIQFSGQIDPSPGSLSLTDLSRKGRGGIAAINPG